MKIATYGYASGIGAGDAGTADGPAYVKTHFQNNDHVALDWREMITPQGSTNSFDSLPEVISLCTELAECCNQSVARGEIFLSVGGDHSMGAGTWSGVAHAMRGKGDIGLIWIDAHMDAHTPDTSESGNVHGMPVAHLLGHGDQAWASILDDQPKIKPENLVIIGARDYQQGEDNLLKKLNVRIYFMEEIQEKGIEQVLKEAIEIVTQNTAGFGVSLDIDGIDPKWVPGTGTPVDNGIEAPALIDALPMLPKHPAYLGAELAEFNPHLDDTSTTFDTVSACINALF